MLAVLAMLLSATWASPTSSQAIVLAQYYDEDVPEPDPYELEDPDDLDGDGVPDDEAEEMEPEPEDQTFGGYDCLDDCSGHSAGFLWAQEHTLRSALDCEGNSASFVEGCRAYFEDPYRDPYEDDAGNPVP